MAFGQRRHQGFSDMDGTTLPLGRSKWESTMTLAPFSASSRMVGAWRSMRVASVTLPSFNGTLRSARTSTRFALHRKIIERVEVPSLLLPFRGQSSLPIATAVSAMRLEKPHSLSYQVMIETKLPSITLVWSSAKLDEAGLWLKSTETSLSCTTSRMPLSGPLAAAT